MNRYFNENTDDKHMKRYSTASIIRQIKIKATMKYHLMLTENSKSKK